MNFSPNPVLPAIFPVSIKGTSIYPAAQAKNLESSWVPVILSYPYPSHQHIPSVLSSEHTQNPTTSCHLHCYHLGPSHHHLSPGLLQWPPSWSSGVGPVWRVLHPTVGQTFTLSSDMSNGIPSQCFQCFHCLQEEPIARPMLPLIKHLTIYLSCPVLAQWPWAFLQTHQADFPLRIFASAILFPRFPHCSLPPFNSCSESPSLNICVIAALLWWL